jgi:hypothetical protein
LAATQPFATQLRRVFRSVAARNQGVTERSAERVAARATELAVGAVVRGLTVAANLLLLVQRQHRQLIIVSVSVWISVVTVVVVLIVAAASTGH